MTEPDETDDVVGERVVGILRATLAKRRSPAARAALYERMVQSLGALAQQMELIAARLASGDEQTTAVRRRQREANLVTVFVHDGKERRVLPRGEAIALVAGGGAAIVTDDDVSTVRDVAGTLRDLRFTMAAAPNEHRLTPLETSLIDEARRLVREGLRGGSGGRSNKQPSLADVAEYLANKHGLRDSRGRAYDQGAMARLLLRGARHVVDESGVIYDLDNAPAALSGSRAAVAIARAIALGRPVLGTRWRIAKPAEVARAIAAGAVVDDDADIREDESAESDDV